MFTVAHRVSKITIGSRYTVACKLVELEIVDDKSEEAETLFEYWRNEVGWVLSLGSLGHRSA